MSFAQMFLQVTRGNVSLSEIKQEATKQDRCKKHLQQSRLQVFQAGLMTACKYSKLHMQSSFPKLQLKLQTAKKQPQICWTEYRRY
jgi:hypothetical protein